MITSCSDKVIPINIPNNDHLRIFVHLSPSNLRPQSLDLSVRFSADSTLKGPPKV